jgi:GT2 family glycosyltransferase
MPKNVVAIVPTYNEPDELRIVVESLANEKLAQIVVVNAGDSLPTDVARHVEEIRVPATSFWTACVQRGIERARELGPDFVLLTNADTPLMEGTLSKLLAVASEKTVACSAAYVESESGPRLIYAYQDPMGFLLYGRLVRPWQHPQDAPDVGYPITLTGGQGVVIPMSALMEHDLDAERFPHYASDHDLWLTLREHGFRLVLVPGAGVLNRRAFGARGSKGRLTALWLRMTSPMLAESWPTMWRLRRKHLSLPLAIVSTVLAFAMRWTIGLPKIIKRL